MTHKEFADSLREVAAFFEQHEELPVPGGLVSIGWYEPSGKEQMTAIAKAFGTCKKKFEGEWFRLIKTFGVITLTATDLRSSVCERVQVGTKVIPEQISPAVEARPEEVIPEHEEAIYEGYCPESLLQGGSDAR